MKKEKTAVLSLVFGQINFTFSFNLVNLSNEYSTNFCSCSRIFSIHQIDLMYSKDFNKLIAQIIFGVPASNFE
jgi:hypothetical protein